MSKIMVFDKSGRKKFIPLGLWEIMPPHKYGLSLPQSTTQVPIAVQAAMQAARPAAAQAAASGPSETVKKSRKRENKTQV